MGSGGRDHGMLDNLTKEETMKRLHIFLIAAMACLTLGCSSHYYRVTDPSSGKNYFTKKVDEAGRAGAVKFKDERTGGNVTLQSSEVKEISEGEYDAGLVAKPASSSQPAPPVAPSVPSSQK
jgi:hypothetical protein